MIFMVRFTMNGYSWRVCYVNPHDPILVDRTGVLTVATTDPGTLSVYISNALTGSFKTRVVIHELGHCALFSFNLLDDIHRVVPQKYWIEAEEWVCNFIADYGQAIFDAGYSVLREDSLYEVPDEIEKLIA